jgi:aldose sugar dehydrogenase
MTKVFSIILGAVLLAACSAKQEEYTGAVVVTESLTFSIDTLATGLTNPWGMAFLPDGRILIAERPGNLRIYADGVLQPGSIEGIPEAWAHGQGGLLDVVLHPDYSQNGWIYLAYSARGEGDGGNTAIARGKLTGNRFTETELLFHGQPHTPAAHHFGTRIVFDDANYMYFTIGDRGSQNNAQLLSNHNGTVMRFHDDGRVPSDNPFVNTPDAMPEIWSYGHRNIQGMALHPTSRELWTHEHGPQGGDEINLIRKGANYGWPLATFGINYNGTIVSPDTTLPGKTDPVLYWVPSIAPCGLAFVDSDKYPGWHHNMLVGALAGQHIQRVVIENDQVTHTEKILQDFARFRDIRQGPDGYIYALTEGPGLFIRLTPR